MKKFILIFLIPFVFGLQNSCTTKPNKEEEKILSKKAPEIKKELTFNEPKTREEFVTKITLEALIKNSLIISSREFKITKESQENIELNLKKLSADEVDFFYNTDEQKMLYEHYDFESYFYGRMKSVIKKTPFIILSLNRESGIFLDCFIVDSNCINTDMLRLSYLVLDANYSNFGSGEFINDTIYKQLTVDEDYEIEVDESYEGKIRETTIIDSALIRHIIHRNGEISEEKIFESTDTIINTSNETITNH